MFTVSIDALKDVEIEAQNLISRHRLRSHRSFQAIAGELVAGDFPPGALNAAAR